MASTGQVSPYSKPLRLHPPIRQGNERVYLDECIQRGEFASGPFVERLEKALAEFLGAEHVVAVSSGTAGLELALLAAGVEGVGDVIIPALTFAATANAVMRLGAEPIIVDVDENWQLDAEKVADFMEKRHAPVEAILPVDLMGVPSGFLATTEVQVVHDSCESLGAQVGEGRVGSKGLAVFSFNGNKIITGGSGGAVATDDADQAGNMRIWRDQGKDPDEPTNHITMGSNFRMSNMQAAVALAQLEHLPSILMIKQSISRRYDELLEGVEEVGHMPVVPGRVSNNWLYTLTVPEWKMKQVLAAFGEEGIEVRQMFRPLNMMPAFVGCVAWDIVWAPKIYSTALSLPSGVGIRQQEQEYVVDVLKKALQ